MSLPENFGSPRPDWCTCNSQWKDFHTNECLNNRSDKKTIDIPFTKGHMVLGIFLFLNLFVVPLGMIKIHPAVGVFYVLTGLLFGGIANMEIDDFFSPITNIIPIKLRFREY